MSDPNVQIVLFRGVGGATQLPVARLREVLAACGCAEVRTYINSGNAVVRSDLDKEQLHDRVADAVREAFGFDKEIFLRNRGEWRAMVAANPFSDAIRHPTSLHLFALSDTPDKEAVENLVERLSPTERVHVDGTTLYFHTPDGFGRSKTAPAVDRLLRVSSTARNWNTAIKLLEIADAL